MKSEHFEVGSWLWGWNIWNQRARSEIIARPGNGWMLVRYEDGTTEILRPHALWWERDNHDPYYRGKDIDWSRLQSKVSR